MLLKKPTSKEHFSHFHEIPVLTTIILKSDKIKHTLCSSAQDVTDCVCFQFVCCATKLDIASEQPFFYIFCFNMSSLSTEQKI